MMSNLDLPKAKCTINCLKRKAFSSGYKCSFISHKFFYISAFNCTNILVSSSRDSEIRDVKSTRNFKNACVQYIKWSPFWCWWFYLRQRRTTYFGCINCLVKERNILHQPWQEEVRWFHCNHFVSYISHFVQLTAKTWIC